MKKFLFVKDSSDAARVYAEDSFLGIEDAGSNGLNFSFVPSTNDASNVDVVDLTVVDASKRELCKRFKEELAFGKKPFVKIASIVSGEATVVFGSLITAVSITADS